MKSLLALLSLFPLLLQSCLTPFPTSPDKEAIRDKTYKKAIRSAQRFIDSLQGRQDIPGISVCVGSKEKILWAEGFGYASLENKQPVRVSSRFRIGSVSKSLTSVALGKLYEEHKLVLDTPLQVYVPAFPRKQYPLTIRQLAGHLAGIRHYQEKDFLYYPKRYKTVTEALTLFQQDSLLFPPGTAYAYSTYGYSLVSAAIETASGQDFLTYMHSAVFVPLHMPHTLADFSDSLVPNRVDFYEHSQGKLVHATLVDNSYKWAGGGMLSTPVDLVNLGRGLLTNSVLTAQTTELLFTSQHLADGRSTGYGLGWRMGEDTRGRRIIHHGGTIEGGRTFLLLYPEENLVLAITANMSGVTINLPEVETIATYFLSNPVHK